MRLLLDTQVLLWWLGEDKRLGKRAVRDIGSPSNQIFISPLSVFECAAKERIGKLQVSTRQIVEQLTLEHFQELPYDFWSAQKLAEVPLQDWKDPFDFALMAQAAAKNLVLLTADHKILAVRWPELSGMDARR
ncbi:MAG TPA: type II toxin-antitoxin system VapC family toxin [Candidatus Limnocylindria bacterium]|nr:type II toxin-antitoxin system VapC family toxin [Candidatus Limnocylindria bacterium]